MKSKQALRADVRNALGGLKKVLETQFAEGRIWYEADLHQVVLSHLTSELVLKDEQWVVGSQHWIDGVRPDVICYYRADQPFAEFLRTSDETIVAILEIKFRSPLGDDIAKLELRAKNRNILTWMIYGDHFDKDIHPSNCGAQQQRAEDIEQWVASEPEMRGSTVLKCAEIDTLPGPHGDVLDAIKNDDFYWHWGKRGTRDWRGSGE